MQINRKFILLFFIFVLLSPAFAQTSDEIFKNVSDALSNARNPPEPAGGTLYYVPPGGTLSTVGPPVTDEQLANVLGALDVAGEGIIPAPKNEISSVEITLAAEENPRRDARLSYSWPERMLLTVSDNIKASNASEFIVYPYEVKVGDMEIQNLSKPAFAVEGALKQYFDTGKFKIEITGDAEPYVLALSADFSEFENAPERIDGTIKFSYKDAFFERQPSIEIRIEKNPCKTLAEDSAPYLLALNGIADCHNLAAGITKIAFFELFLRHYKYYYPSEGYEAHLREEIKNASPEEKEKNREYFEDSEALLKYDGWILSSYGKSLSYLEEVKEIASEDEDSTIDEVAEGAIAVENARKDEWLAYKEFRKDPFDPDYREAWVASVVALKKSEREFGIVANLPKEEQAKEISDEELIKQTNKEINENYGYNELLMDYLKEQAPRDIDGQIKLTDEAMNSTFAIFSENYEKLLLSKQYLESEKEGISHILDLLEGRLEIPANGTISKETEQLKKELEEGGYSEIKGNRLSILQINEIAKSEEEKLFEEQKRYWPITANTPDETRRKVRILGMFEDYWDGIKIALENSAGAQVRKRLYVVEKDFISNINEADFLLNEVQTLEIEQQNLKALIAAFEESTERSKWDVSVLRIALDAVKQNKEKAIAEAGRLQIQSNGIGKIVKLLEDGNSWAQIGAINNDAEIQTAVTDNKTVQFLIEKDSLLLDAQENAKEILLKIEDVDKMNNKQRAAEFSRIVKEYVGKNLEDKQAELAYKNAKRYQEYMDDYGIEALRLRAYEEYIQTSVDFADNGWGRLAEERAKRMDSFPGRIGVGTRLFIEGMTTPKMIVTLVAINVIVRGFVIISSAREAGTMESFLARASLRSANYTANVRALEVPKASTLQKLKEFVFTRDINPITRAFPKLSLNYWTGAAANKLGSAIFTSKYGGLAAAESALAEAKEAGLVATLSKNEFLPISNAERSFAEFAGHKMSIIETSGEFFYLDGGSGIMRIAKSVEGEGGVITLNASKIAELAQKTRNLPRAFAYLKNEGLATEAEVQYAQRLSAIFDDAAEKAGAPLKEAVSTSFEAFTQAEAKGYVESLLTFSEGGGLPALTQIDAGLSAITGRESGALISAIAGSTLAATIPADYVASLSAFDVPEWYAAGAATVDEGVLLNRNAIYMTGDVKTFRGKELINVFGSRNNFLDAIFELHYKDPVFKDLINYIATKNKMNPATKIADLFGIMRGGESIKLYNCDAIACYFPTKDSIAYRAFSSEAEMYAFAWTSPQTDVAQVKQLIANSIIGIMPHEAAHAAFNELSSSGQAEWMTHIKNALEGKVSDFTVVSGFAKLSNNPLYKDLSFAGKANELFAYKTGKLPAFTGNEFSKSNQYMMSFDVTSYDLWFLRKHGILSEQTYQVLLKDPSIVYLGKDAFYTGPYAYSPSGLSAGRAQHISAETCSFGCSFSAENLSVNEIAITQGVQSGENAIEAQQMGKEVGVAIKDFGRVEEIAINSEVVATPEQTAKILIDCSDCEFRIEGGLLTIETTKRSEIKIPAEQFKEIKQIEIAVPLQNAAGISYYRLPTNYELAQGAVPEGGALLQVSTDSAGKMNLMVISTDLGKKIVFLYGSFKTLFSPPSFEIWVKEGRFEQWEITKFNSLDASGKIDTLIEWRNNGRITDAEFDALIAQQGTGGVSSILRRYAVEILNKAGIETSYSIYSHKVDLFASNFTDYKLGKISREKLVNNLKVFFSQDEIDRIMLTVEKGVPPALFADLKERVLSLANDAGSMIYSRDALERIENVDTLKEMSEFLTSPDTIKAIETKQIDTAAANEIFGKARRLFEAELASRNTVPDLLKFENDTKYALEFIDVETTGGAFVPLAYEPLAESFSKLAHQKTLSAINQRISQAESLDELMDLHSEVADAQDVEFLDKDSLLKESGIYDRIKQAADAELSGQLGLERLSSLNNTFEKLDQKTALFSKEKERIGNSVYDALANEMRNAKTIEDVRRIKMQLEMTPYIRSEHAMEIKRLLSSFSNEIEKVFMVSETLSGGVETDVWRMERYLDDYKKTFDYYKKKGVGLSEELWANTVANAYKKIRERSLDFIARVEKAVAEPGLAIGAVSEITAFNGKPWLLQKDQQRIDKLIDKIEKGVEADIYDEESKDSFIRSLAEVPRIINDPNSYVRKYLEKDIVGLEKSIDDAISTENGRLGRISDLSVLEVDLAKADRYNYGLDLYGNTRKRLDSSVVSALSELIAGKPTVGELAIAGDYLFRRNLPITRFWRENKELTAEFATALDTAISEAQIKDLGNLAEISNMTDNLTRGAGEPAKSRIFERAKELINGMPIETMPLEDLTKIRDSAFSINPDLVRQNARFVERFRGPILDSVGETLYPNQIGLASRTNEPVFIPLNLTAPSNSGQTRGFIWVTEPNGMLYYKFRGLGEEPYLIDTKATPQAVVSYGSIGSHEAALRETQILLGNELFSRLNSASTLSFAIEANPGNNLQIFNHDRIQNISRLERIDNKTANALYKAFSGLATKLNVPEDQVNIGINIPGQGIVNETLQSFKEKFIHEEKLGELMSEKMPDITAQKIFYNWELKEKIIVYRDQINGSINTFVDDSYQFTTHPNMLKYISDQLSAQHSTPIRIMEDDVVKGYLVKNHGNGRNYAVLTTDRDEFIRMRTDLGRSRLLDEFTNHTLQAGLTAEVYGLKFESGIPFGIPNLDMPLVSGNE